MACGQDVCRYRLAVEFTTYRCILCSREGIVDLSDWNAQMAAKVGAPVYGAIGLLFDSICGCDDEPTH